MIKLHFALPVMSNDDQIAFVPLLTETSVCRPDCFNIFRGAGTR
jgi:hypothetical protein